MKAKLLFLLLTFSLKLTAQYYNQQADFLKANSVWTFGQNAGLNFNTGTPVAINSAAGALGSFGECAASVADPVTGQLLFYFDGVFCRDANSSVMPNGYNILGNSQTSLQGSTIVPVIDSPGKYYLFTLYGLSGYGDSATDASGGFLFYSKIDMSLNNGMGDVVPNEKNIILSTDTLSESMVAVPGEQCDIWLVVHTAVTPVFKAFRISGSGIAPSPVVSAAGAQIQGYAPVTGLDIPAYSMGGMAISPDRQHLAISSWNPFVEFLAGIMVGEDSIPADLKVVGVMLFAFDPVTGIVSDGLVVGNRLTPYTVCFSPDNTKLYMVNEEISLTSSNFPLLQFDVSIPDSATIAASKTLISNSTGPDFSNAYLRLFRDTIYISYFNYMTLSTINDPNQSGLACDYQLGPVALNGGTHTLYALPNEVVYPAPAQIEHVKILDTIICSEDWLNGIVLNPASVYGNYTYQWNDGSQDTVRTIYNAGTYWVKYSDGCNLRVDTFEVAGGYFQEPFITVNVFVLGTTASYDSYQWLLNGNVIPGANGSTYAVTQNGDYSVVVTSNSGCTATSPLYKVTNSTDIEDIALLARQIEVYPNPAVDWLSIKSPVNVDLVLSTVEGRAVKSLKKGKQIPVQDLAEGMYWLRVYDEEGRLIKILKIVKSK